MLKLGRLVRLYIRELRIGNYELRIGNLAIVITYASTNCLTDFLPDSACLIDSNRCSALAGFDNKYSVSCQDNIY
jgi:hypothetical protein